MRRVVFVALVIALSASAKFRSGEKVPVDRLIANVQARFASYEDPAAANYLLGRLESLKFSNEQEVQVIPGGPGATPSISSYSDQYRFRQTPISSDAKALFFSSIRHYRQAILLRSKDALYHFSLAWMAEQGQQFERELGPPPAELVNGPKKTWRMLAIQEYGRANELSEEPREFLGPGRSIPLQSAEGLIENLRAELSDGHDVDAKFLWWADERIAQAQATVDRLKRLPRAITPLIFSADENATFADLMAQVAVTFDLDGYSENRSWPWVRSNTMFLVWDPDNTGHIASGRQMFGSSTWWMFWNNGFEPLAALDDNRDGILSGTELNGIAVWEDRNQNGISDPGEVTPAPAFGIESIKVTNIAVQDGIQVIRGAILMRDGRQLTLFDWTPQSR